MVGAATIDLPLDELRAYRPERDEPSDFDQFWEVTLDEARSRPPLVSIQPVDTLIETFAVADVTFAGFAGHPVKAWFITPGQARAPLPCVIEYIGYGGGRGSVTERLLWGAAGYAHLVVDNRGQAGGDTEDPDRSAAPHDMGHLTDGLESPHAYYYRRLMTDAVRAVDAAVGIPAVDPTRIAVTGISQGGGLALAVAGLHPVPKALMADVPFLCHFRRALSIATDGPYGEIVRHLARHRGEDEAVLRVLSYFDGLNFAARAQVPALFAVGLRDVICPPSTVFAAVNHYAGPKETRVYAFNGHEGGQAHHDIARLEFAARTFEEAT